MPRLLIREARPRKAGKVLCFSAIFAAIHLASHRRLSGRLSSGNCLSVPRRPVVNNNAMKFFPDLQNIDMREELAAILYGREDVTQQGRLVIHRRILDETCPACWDPNTMGSRRPNCSYCQGESRMFRERKETMVLSLAWRLSTSLESSGLDNTHNQTTAIRILTGQPPTANTLCS